VERRPLHLVAVNWRDMRNPEAGGAEVHLYEILVRMVQRGHRVTWLAAGYPGCSKFDTYDGIDVIRRGSWYNANFALRRALKAFLSREKPDLIIEDINKIPFFTPRLTDVPVLPVIPHLFGVTVFRETNPVLASYVWFWERFIPSVYRDCNFCVISPSTRDDLVGRGIARERIDVVLCGLDHGTYRRIEGSQRYERPTVVHFGRVRKYKAIDVVIRAVKRIRDALGDVRLVIIGDGPELDNLKKIAADLDMGDTVEFTGRLCVEDMVATLNRCHLFMNASPKEGWGLTVVEANACGVPVVGSDRPGLKDSILDGKTGFLVEYGDDAAFAARGLELLSDPELWKRMSAAGLEWAQTMTWERTADEMEQLFLREAR
jgi:glycosyltransferase involved in cell wall biosynthesis